MVSNVIVNQAAPTVLAVSRTRRVPDIDSWPPWSTDLPHDQYGPVGHGLPQCSHRSLGIMVDRRDPLRMVAREPPQRQRITVDAEPGHDSGSDVREHAVRTELLPGVHIRDVEFDQRFPELGCRVAYRYRL